MSTLLVSITLLAQFTACLSFTEGEYQKDMPVDVSLTLNKRPKEITLQPSSAVYQQVLIKIPSDERYTFVTIQLHTQYKTVSTSFTRKYVYGSTYNSSNPAILKKLQGDERLIQTYIGSNSSSPALSFLFAVGFRGEVPIPGACCLTCAMEIDPNIELTYVSGRAFLFFHRASRYYPPGEAPQCDNNDNPGTYLLRYRVYYHYIKDFSSASLFDAIWKMSTPEKIEKYGTPLSDISGRSSLKLTLQPIKGQGVVFNIIVYDPKSELKSAYIPVSTYHCHFTGPKADCYVKKDVTSIVYCVFCAVIGVVLFVAGIKLLPLLFFITGWLFYWLFIYVALYRLYIDAANDLSRCDGTERDVMVMSSLCAICGGAVTLFYYAFQRLLVLSFLTVSVFIGMFMTSIIFYTPIGHLSFWDGDQKFLFAFCCISICLATFFFFVPKFLCIFSSSVIGSYAVILVPNYFFNGSLQYIVLASVLRLSSSPDFFLERPYCTSDYILSAVWVLLFVIGITLQYCMNRDENMELSGLYFSHNPLTRLGKTLRGNRRNDSETTRAPGASHSSDLQDSLFVPNERTPLFGNGHQPNPSLSFNSAEYFGGSTSSFNHPTNNYVNGPPSAPQRPSSPPPPYTE